jgi:hypothetical protein
MTTTSTKGVRPPAVAGRFYPSDAVELRELILSFLDSAPAPKGPAPKAIIVPHAGYIYSGPIAATAYARLRPAREVIKRVVLLGPSHFVAFRGLATTSATGLATPLGVIPVDVEAVGKLAGLLTVLDAAHAREHSLEVQLPFLQMVLGDFSVVPLLVGEATADEVRPVLEALWGGPETCFVISSDLSHYHDAETARQLDRLTAIAIEALKPESIVEDGACGRIPVCGLLRAAAAHGLSAKTLDLRNSGDTGGPRDRVVGYGAFAFEERCHE